MKRMNPDNLKDSVIDSFKAGGIGAVAALLAGLGLYGISRIDYGAPAPGAMLDNAATNRAVEALIKEFAPDSIGAELLEVEA